MGKMIDRVIGRGKKERIMNVVLAMGLATVVGAPVLNTLRLDNLNRERVSQSQERQDFFQNTGVPLYGPEEKIEDRMDNYWVAVEEFERMRAMNPDFEKPKSIRFMGNTYWEWTAIDILRSTIFPYEAENRGGDIVIGYDTPSVRNVMLHELFQGDLGKKIELDSSIIREWLELCKDKNGKILNLESMVSEGIITEEAASEAIFGPINAQQYGFVDRYPMNIRNSRLMAEEDITTLFAYIWEQPQDMGMILDRENEGARALLRKIKLGEELGLFERGTLQYVNLVKNNEPLSQYSYDGSSHDRVVEKIKGRDFFNELGETAYEIRIRQHLGDVYRKLSSGKYELTSNQIDEVSGGRVDRQQDLVICAIEEYKRALLAGFKERTAYTDSIEGLIKVEPQNEGVYREALSLYGKEYGNKNPDLIQRGVNDHLIEKGVLPRTPYKLTHQIAAASSQ